ncbi:putative natural product biosynthesis protein [Pseudomonas orientalis]|uniref:Putative natural product biosynthesis protein n=1 Tax=Pseudomonas orientalis TaxID=76758 RepID=A0A2L0RXF9_9PSED|nr:putative natural product biosynthesis protein [Pseudomonas orientalis]AUZ46787.1 putative natural product biosynthesis protein [Pseudomonas orientalis]
MNHQLPARARRLVSKAAGRSRAEPALPDYPSNARCFVHLDARLLPHWHTVFDVCPALLKLDPPEGLNLFRSFMTWAYRHQLPLDWTYHLNLCRWLLSSPYRAQVDADFIDAFMTAAAARWILTDDSQALGIVLSWRGGNLFDWKVDKPSAAERQVLPVSTWDFAWCALSERGAFSGWLPVP